MVRIDGLQKLWWVLISVMALIVGIFLFSRLWRRADITTDAEFYELRYEGKSAAFLRGFRAFFSGVVQNLLIMGWVIFGMSTVITILTGVPKVPAVAVCIAVALTYATFSGFYGVVVTDFVQFFIATFSMIALAVISVVMVRIKCRREKVMVVKSIGISHTILIEATQAALARPVLARDTLLRDTLLRGTLRCNRDALRSRR